MVLLGRQYGGEALLTLGIAERLLPDISSLEAAAAALARELAANAPLSLKAAKIAFQELTRRDAPPDLDRVRVVEDACYASADYAEGRFAKLEKRSPVFRGR
jgi:enoyl-CoA hydratase/carnithine racemase